MRSDFLVGKQVRQLVRGVRSAVQGPTGWTVAGLVDGGGSGVVGRRQGCACAVWVGGRRMLVLLQDVIVQILIGSRQRQYLRTSRFFRLKPAQNEGSSAAPPSPHHLCACELSPPPTVPAIQPTPISRFPRTQYTHSTHLLPQRIHESRTLTAHGRARNLCTTRHAIILRAAHEWRVTSSNGSSSGVNVFARSFLHMHIGRANVKLLLSRSNSLSCARPSAACRPRTLSILVILKCNEYSSTSCHRGVYLT